MIIYSVKSYVAENGREVLNTRYFGSFELIADYILCYARELSYCELDGVNTHLTKEQIVYLLNKHFAGEGKDASIYFSKYIEDILSGKYSTRWVYIVTPINVEM